MCLVVVHAMMTSASSVRENYRVTGHSLIIMLCEATQWPKTHYFNECPVTRWFSHLKSATVYHPTFVDKNVQWFNDKLYQVDFNGRGNKWPAGLYGLLHCATLDLCVGIRLQCVKRLKLYLILFLVNFLWPER